MQVMALITFAPVGANVASEVAVGLELTVGFAPSVNLKDIFGEEKWKPLAVSTYSFPTNFPLQVST